MKLVFSFLVSPGFSSHPTQSLPFSIVTNCIWTTSGTAGSHSWVGPSWKHCSTSSKLQVTRPFTRALLCAAWPLSAARVAVLRSLLRTPGTLKSLCLLHCGWNDCEQILKEVFPENISISRERKLGNCNFVFVCFPSSLVQVMSVWLCHDTEGLSK